MRNTLIGLAMGGFALLVGVVWLLGAVNTRRSRAQIGPTYAATGGPVYTAVQVGCAGVLMLIGIGIVVAVLVRLI
ncbi:MAG TPA: hypothetical protein VIO84_08230 [Candidatus Dormibacteraeota bacterium]